MSQLLDYFAEIHRSFLHAKGELATEHLIDWLDCQPGEKILEFGIGTGATLIKLISRYKQTKFYGIDVSDLMIVKAIDRLKFCQLDKQAVIEKIVETQFNDVADSYFDKIYVESVLGIQDDESLQTIISLFNRILKPSGKLLLNETIWLESTLPETIHQFNGRVKDKFGIIQSNSTYAYLRDWKLLLIANQFDILKIEEVDNLKEFKRKKNFNEWLSKLFSLLGAVYGKLFLQKEFLLFKETDLKHQPTQKIMAGYLIMALNLKKC
ncbi:class I SAM-dependent methyltransferase [Spirosoma endbachense]|uniref:Methyltransferase domain-containing protein n=1 Tax=Spirosoma endbachense TaxID=2666025 RepID=A0A6P1W7B7_9BACT|nr:class I SAM-dependent methyltransferase [Spirosoma endbachense]QHV99909.1 methyltransferase domain-containing protein [Spirosoma endbachense]